MLFSFSAFLSVFLSTQKTLKVLWNLIPKDLDIGSFRNSSGENESPAIGNYLQFPAELDWILGHSPESELLTFNMRHSNIVRLSHVSQLEQTVLNTLL